MSSFGNGEATKLIGNWQHQWEWNRYGSNRSWTIGVDMCPRQCTIQRL